MLRKSLFAFRSSVMAIVVLCASPLWSQYIDFQHNATTNACIEDPNRAIVTLQNNCNVTLGPGNATVLDCRLHQVAANGPGPWMGIFVPTATAAVPVGWGCFFEACGPGGLTLTCFLPVPRNSSPAMSEDKLTVKFVPKKNTSVEDKPKQGAPKQE